MSAPVAREAAALVALVLAHRAAKRRSAQAARRMTRADCAAYARAVKDGAPLSPAAAAFERAQAAERSARDALHAAIAAMVAGG